MRGNRANVQKILLTKQSSQEGRVKKMIIEHDLLKKQKRRKNSAKVKVDLYAYATELYEELDSLGIVERMKNVPQLGVIRVENKLLKSRYDYVFLQLYFHQLIKKELQDQLKYTYNNPVKSSEFCASLQYPPECKIPTIGDLLQILTIAYNVGHFYNTFVASRAAVLLADKKTDYYNMIVNSSDNEQFRTVAQRLLNENNYQRLHLLNSLLVLERCDQAKLAVVLAKELIYAYIDETNFDDESKLNFVFKLFRSVRSVSYISYDLQIAKTPITIDLCDDKTILILFRELLSAYNDNRSTEQLLNSISKMLDDTVYNESSNAICYYAISNKIAKKVLNIQDWRLKNYYEDFWLNNNSIFNISYSQRRDYLNDGILKLTFVCTDKNLSKKLFQSLESINNSRVGYYDRHQGERTILVSIKKHCERKTQVALKILRTVISCLREITNIDNSDVRFLLASKFFLHYFSKEYPIVIKPTIDHDVCVLCARGKKQRIVAVQSLLKNRFGTEDERHEVEHLCYILSQDMVNDTTIAIPASILVNEKNQPGHKLCEFDGIIIFPMRKEKQVVLLEAKNTTHAPSYGRKCLCKKLKTLEIPYSINDIKIHDRDASLSFTI